MKLLTDELLKFAEFIGFRETGGKLVADYVKTLPRNMEIDFDVIQEIVLGVMWLGNVEDFYNHKGFRKNEYVSCREFISLFCRMLTPMSFQEIADKLGKKSHATILTGISTLIGQMYLPKNRRAFENIIAEFTLRGYLIGDKMNRVISAQPQAPPQQPPRI